MTHTYAQGTLVWTKHEEEVWIQAEIVTANEKEIIVKTVEDPDGRIVLPPNEPLPLRSMDIFTSEGLTALDDLTQLTHLHEPAVLSSLQNRFDVDKIYTFTGPILIALNPFKHIRNLYDEDVLRSFISTKPISTPHVFNTSNASFRGICDRHKCQTVLISGESGAGKTVTTKHVMKFLAIAGAGDGEVTEVEKQVLESNPLLEAFGNARTLRNDNSSRFGKFIELQFQPSSPAATQGVEGGHSRLCGAKVQTYLLEKVRVNDQQEGERNYHIFYEACAAVVKNGGTQYKYPQVMKRDQVKAEQVLNLDGFADLSNFSYLTRSSCKVLKDQDDIEMFECRIHAMQTIGIKPEDMDSILSSTAAVLHLGNTKFDAPASNSEGSVVMSECENSISVASKLLGVGRKELEQVLCNVTRKTRTETLRSPVNVRQAADNRDALAKSIYGMVFTFIVDSANKAIGYRADVKLFVGVLDIFGFECFKMNSFEQLCINFTNERLQQFFNQFVFKLEEQLYEREGIPWSALDFPDNQDAVDLLQAKTTGIFAILDEECMVPAGSDTGFCNKVIKTHKGHRRFDEIKVKPTWFVVKHFAGPVQYCSDMFLDKNKDTLSNDIVEAMGNSSNPFIANLFRKDIKFQELFEGAKEEDKRTKKKKYSVSSEFKEQLASLMEIVDTTEPHFIRCIKPNPMNVCDTYDRKAVAEQLRYGGVLQVVQVSRAGYPVRINHQECWDDYKIIATPTVISGLKHLDDAKLRAQKLLDHLTKELNIPPAAHGQSWAVGKSLVFFKQFAYERLKFARLELLIKSVMLIQAHWRRRVKQRMYKVLRIFTRHSQALLRGKQARLDLQQRRRERAAVRIQSVKRGVKDWKAFRNIVKKVVRIQAWRRGILGRKRSKEMKIFTSATLIQRTWRRRQESLVYASLRKAIFLAQHRWRMHSAKSQLKKLKQEAKEVGALMAKSQKAQEQAMSERKKNEELEAHSLQLTAEKNGLVSKVSQLQDSVTALKAEMEDLKKGAEEAARIAAENAGKTSVDTESLEQMKRDLQEKNDEIKSLQDELAKMKETYAKAQEDLQGSENRYHQLLKMQAMGAGQQISAAAAAPVRPRAAAGKLGSNRNVDIQLVGMSGVGKTPLLEKLIMEHDPVQLQKFRDQMTNLMSHHQVQLGDRMLKLLDCSGNVRAQHLVKEWFARAHWVFVVYDTTNAKSLDAAIAMVPEVEKAGAKVVLFGNTWNQENKSLPVMADIVAAKDCAVRVEGMAIERSMLIDAVKWALNQSDEGEQQDLAGGDPGGERRSSISAAIDSVKTWFSGPQRSDGNRGVLRPSLKGTRQMKSQRNAGDVSADLRPVQELQDSESAVTCITFGQERLHRHYVLLAAASKDGTVVIYRCYRTEMEAQMLQEMDFQHEEEAQPPPPDHSNIAIHSRLVGHSRAITSIFFNLLEDQLVTTSIDKSVRFWSVDSGEMLKVFTDSSPVPVAAFLPFNPQVFVAANSNAVLRLVNVQNGMVLQKLKVETEVRALKFDDTGLFLLAGTKNGSIHVLEASDSNTLKFKFKVQLARGGVTCITFVPACHNQPACLLVNTSDSSATIIDCTYGPPQGVLTNLAVRHRVRVAHSLLPLKCCYSPSGQGYLISGSEDKEVYIYSLAKGANYKMQYLKHHQVPVVAVAVNFQDTLLASADSLGRIVLWRRMDFSHLPDP